MEKEEKKPLIILTGPTAVGKTAASIGLAKAVGGEIISADSMQVYKEMDIGSAKITPEEMEGVPHHLVDVLEPEEEFNVVRFQELAKEAMKGIYERGHIPIVVGGTGFYIQALLYDIDFTENETDHTYRKELEQLAEEKGEEYLHKLLQEADPESASQIHCHNVKRVIRALEFYHLSGKRISAACRFQTPPCPLHFRCPPGWRYRRLQYIPAAGQGPKACPARPALPFHDPCVLPAAPVFPRRFSCTYPPNGPARPFGER